MPAFTVHKHEIEIPGTCANEDGYKNVEVDVEYSVEWQPADPSVGYMYAYPEITMVSATTEDEVEIDAKQFYDEAMQHECANPSCDGDY